MRQIFVSLTLVAGLMLAACAGTVETRATNALGIACTSFAATLEELAPLRKAGKLSAASVDRVEGAKAVVDPVCLPDAIVDPKEAVGIVRQGIDVLKSIKDSVSRTLLEIYSA